MRVAQKDSYLTYQRPEYKMIHVWSQNSSPSYTYRYVKLFLWCVAGHFGGAAMAAKAAGIELPQLLLAILATSDPALQQQELAID